MTKRLKIELVNKITKKNPYANKNILNAHTKANKAEKDKYPQGYQQAKKMDNKLHKHEYAGENFVKNNTIKISKRIPKSMRKEVILHEKVELKQRKRKNK